MTPQNFDPQIPDPLPPTFEVPTPDIPQASFSLIQEQKNRVNSTQGFYDWLLDLIKKWIPDILGVIVGSLIGLIELIAAWFIKIFFRITRGADFGSDEVVAQVVGGLFGVDVAKAAFTDLTNRDAMTPVANTLIEAMFVGLGARYSGVTALPNNASTANAEKFLSTILKMEIDSYALGLTFELASIGAIDKVGELADNVQRGMGLGRMARRVLQPPVKALVIDPFQKAINQTFLPTLLTAEMDIRQYLRGTIDRTTLDIHMQWKGYSPDKVEALINFHRVHLSFADLFAGIEHGLLQDQPFYDLMQAQGYDHESAALRYNIEIAKQKNTASLALAHKALEEFTHGNISGNELDTYIHASELTPMQQDHLAKLALFTQTTKRAKIPLQQGVQLVEKGIWTIDQWRTNALDHGYSLADVDDLELLLLQKIVDQADAAKKRADAAKAKADSLAARIAKQKAAADKALAEVEEHGVSIARYETLVKDGLRTMADYQHFLALKGIAPDNVAAFAAHLQNVIDAAKLKKAAQPGATGSAKAKGLPISVLEHAVKAGNMTMGEFESRLTTAGVVPADVAVLVELLTEEIAAAKVKADAIAAAHAAALIKHVNLGQEFLAARQGIIGVADFQAWLHSKGFADPDAAILVQELRNKMAADAAALARKKVVAPGGVQKGLTAAQVEQEVRAGLAPMSAYGAALMAAGYDAEAQAGLESLLQARIDHDKLVAAARGQANGLLSAKGLSLADYERAVKAKVLPLGAYTDALARAGVSGADAQTLSLVLASSIKNVTPKPTTVPTVQKLLSEKGISLGRLESDVLAGRMQMAAFSTVLTGAGATADQVSQITGVLQLELDQRAAAEALKLAAGKVAGSKQLSLADEVAAIKVNVQGVPDYAALAAKLGYDPAAVQILVKTIQANPKIVPPAAGA
jgi:hypothetical protein